MAGVLEKLGSMLSEFASGPDGVHSRIWNELKPWVMNLGPAASRNWIPRIASGDLCEVPLVARGRVTGECENIGLAICVSCKKPCCLQHAHIDQHANAICYICVADALQVVPPMQRERARQARDAGEAPPPPRGQRQAPPRGANPPPNNKKPGPSPQEVASALSTLGLLPGASWDAIKKAHRKLSAANHPDKASGARAKGVADARFKEIQKAFDVLRQHYPDAK